MARSLFPGFLALAFVVATSASMAASPSLFEVSDSDVLSLKGMTSEWIFERGFCQFQSPLISPVPTSSSNTVGQLSAMEETLNIDEFVQGWEVGVVDTSIVRFFGFIFGSHSP